MSLKESLLRQKSKKNWLREGDQNIKFFHDVIKERRRRNNIVSIQTNDGNKIEDVEGIRGEVFRVFRNRFLELIKEIPSANGLVTTRISDDDNVYLEFEFSHEEIRTTMWVLNEEESPGPGGFNFKFL